MDAEAIVKLAESLASAHHSRSGGGGDPGTAFADYEVPLVEGNFGGAFEGLLRFSDGEFQAFINVAHERHRNVGRRRFTTAHEFGHFSLPPHRDGVRSGKLMHKSTTGFQSREPIEREADIFAAHFLVPTSELRKRFGARRWGAAEVLDAHRHFNASVTCAALRCQASLGGNSTLILWEGQSVSWQRMNRDWWFELPARSVRSADVLAPGSATHRLLQKESSVPSCGFLATGTTRSHWFRRVADWSSENDILIEEAIPLGSFGVLTILRPDCH
jgi:hypothetical protein